eukprot:gene13514-biopygen12977
MPPGGTDSFDVDVEAGGGERRDDAGGEAAEGAAELLPRDAPQPRCGGVGATAARPTAAPPFAPARGAPAAGPGTLVTQRL